MSDENSGAQQAQTIGLAKRNAGRPAPGGAAQKAASGLPPGLANLYTDNVQGNKVTPTIVVVCSLAFMMSVIVLHFMAVLVRLVTRS